MDTKHNDYYVYKWFRLSTGHVFHIGKGRNNRYKDIKHSRNKFFRAVVTKYADDVAVDFVKTGMTDEEACILEKELISEYKLKGECETNFHVGGYGGYTGNYNSLERNKKLSDFAKTRIGPLNPNYGHHMSEYNRKKMSIVHKGKKLSLEHRLKLSKSSTGRIKSKEEIEKIRSAQLGRKIPKDIIAKVAYAISEYWYKIFYRDKLWFACVGGGELEKICLDKLKISRTICEKIVSGVYKPKFKRNMWLKDIKIKKLKKDKECDNLLNGKLSIDYIDSDGKKIIDSVSPYHYIKTEKYKR